MDHHDRSRWRSIDYLQQGSETQQRAYRILTDRQILEQLEPYDAVLAGTFPLDLAIAGSDLDILCEVHIHPLFVAHIENCFGNEDGFRVETTARGRSQMTIVNFAAGSLPVQIYGDPTPVVEQAAYLHMDVEHRLLHSAGGKRVSGFLRSRMRGSRPSPLSRPGSG